MKQLVASFCNRWKAHGSASGFADGAAFRTPELHGLLLCLLTLRLRRADADFFVVLLPP